MSRVGNKPIEVPAGVSVKVDRQRVEVTGPRCKRPLCWSVPDPIQVVLEADGRRVALRRPDDERRSRALHGLSRALVANMVRGAHQGYERRLLIFGAGYNCRVDGGRLHLNVGYMGRGSKTKSQFEIPIPDTLEVVVETAAARGENDPAKLVVRGADRQLVGDFSAKVRAIRPPEPYKGKGIRYEGEYVQRKAGKAFASGGSGG